MTESLVGNKREVVLLVGLVLLTGCSEFDPGDAPAAVSIERVVDLGVVDQDENLRGRDGGYSGIRNGRSVFVFGDTVTSRPNSDGQNWFSNTWSELDTVTASGGLPTLELGVNDAGEPVELLPFTNRERVFNDQHRDGPSCLEPCGARWALWPGPLVDDSARNRSILFYQKIHAEPGEFNFRSVGSALAIWPYADRHPSRAIVAPQAQHPTIMFPAGAPQWHSAAMAEGDMLYAFACDRDGAVFRCRLARAPLESAPLQNTWQYAGESGRWQSDPARSSVLFNGADIMSVSFNQWLGLYLLVYSEPLSQKVRMRTSPRLAGPWSVPVEVFTALPSANGNGWVYDGLSHSQFDEQGGRVIYISYTRDPATVWFAREMRLVRVELDRIE